MIAEAQPAHLPESQPAHLLWEAIIDREVLAGHGLTEREIDVMHLVARGRTNDGVAHTLSISPRTVQKHLERVHEKLSVGTRTAAVAKVIEISAGSTVAWPPAGGRVTAFRARP